MKRRKYIFILHIIEIFCKMTSKTKQHREHIRIQIHTLAKEGFNAEEVSKKLNVCRTTVFKWKNNKTINES